MPLTVSLLGFIPYQLCWFSDKVLLGRILRWRVGVRWYVIALGLPAVLALVILPGYLTNLEGHGIVGPDRKPLWPDTESLRWHRAHVHRKQ